MKDKIYASLVGNPNCGKTSLFNALTGSDMHVGNFPGVTVEKKTGKIKGTDNLFLTDLPGTYSLDPVSDDEKAAVDYLENEVNDVIINVCDGTNLERSLCLTLSLLVLGKPVVAAVNLMDEVEKRGGKIDFALLSSLLGTPALPVSAVKNEGIEELKKQALISVSSHTLIVFPHVSPDELRKKASFIAKKTYKQPAPDKTSRKIDSILTGKHTAIPVFALIMALGFYLIFGLAGPYLSVLAEKLTSDVSVYAGKFLSSINAPEMLDGLITKGVFGGVGTVLSFLPVIVLLFLFLSIIEDTGYMARIAYIADRTFSSAGLSGRAVVPMLTGFGCTVPAVMSCRTLGSKREKLTVMRLLPFLSCPAKVPVYALLCGVFFPEHTAFAIIVIYLSGVLFASVHAVFLKRRSKEKPPVFVMELPPYRFPTAKNTLRLMANKSKEFIKKAFTVILFASVAVWFLSSYNFSLMPCACGNSMLCSIGRFIAPLFSPLGFGDWKAASSLMTGLAAKETIVSTLSLISEGGVAEVFTPLSAVSFMTFTLLYTPCAASLACMKKETGSGMFALSVGVFQFITAWIMSFLVYFLGRLL